MHQSSSLLTSLLNESDSVFTKLTKICDTRKKIEALEVEMRLLNQKLNNKIAKFDRLTDDIREIIKPKEEPSAANFP